MGKTLKTKIGPITTAACSAVLLIFTNGNLEGQGLPIEEANRLIQKGRFGDAVSLLEKEAAGAQGEHRQKLERMLGALQGYRKSRGTVAVEKQPAPPPAGGGEGAGAAGAPSRITALGGFAGGKWLVAMNEGAYRGNVETYHGPGDWPKDWIWEKWKEGFLITHMAGDKDGWVVAMNKGTSYGDQRYFGPGPFPEKEIADAANEGFRITSVAGFRDQWVVVVSERSGLGHQRVTQPTDFNGKKEWIKALWDQDYNITNIAGIDGADGGKFVVIVMSQNSPYGKQWYFRGADWKKWYENEASKEELQITAATGFKDDWIVICSRGHDPGRQRYFLTEDFPKGEISQAWNP